MCNKLNQKVVVKASNALPSEKVNCSSINVSKQSISGTYLNQFLVFNGFTVVSRLVTYSDGFSPTRPFPGKTISDSS